MHRSQMTQAERLRARDTANGVNLAERYVIAGGSLTEVPTERDKAMAAKWNDAPLAGHQTFSFGPDLAKMLSDG